VHGYMVDENITLPVRQSLLGHLGVAFHDRGLYIRGPPQSGGCSVQSLGILFSTKVIVLGTCPTDRNTLLTREPTQGAARSC
jgi:hypothetical protein